MPEPPLLCPAITYPPTYYFPNFIAYLCNENNLQVSTTGGQHQPRQLACDPLGSACLLLGPGHAVVQCSGASGSGSGSAKGSSSTPSARLLFSDIDALAVSAGAATEGLQRGPAASASATSAAWVVLSSTYGVVEVAGGEGTEAAAAHRVAGERDAPSHFDT